MNTNIIKLKEKILAVILIMAFILASVSNLFGLLMTKTKLRFSAEESVSKTKQKPIDTKQSIFYMYLCEVSKNTKTLCIQSQTLGWGNTESLAIGIGTAGS